MEKLAARRENLQSAARVSCPCCGSVIALALLPAEGPDQGTLRTSLAAVGAPSAKPCRDFETRVLVLVAEGETDEAIARQLGAPLHRIKRSVREWMIRLDAQNRTAAAVRAASLGLLEAKQPWSGPALAGNGEAES